MNSTQSVSTLFLDKYGFGPAHDFFVVRDGKAYDSKAIAGAAHGYLPGGLPLKAEEFSCYVRRFVKRAGGSGAQDRRRGRRFGCRSIFTRVVTSVSVSTRCQSDIRGLVTSRADCFGWSGSQV